MKTSWKQIYPRDCYRVLLQMSGETGISFPKVVNIVIREGLIRLGKLPEETSQKHLLQPTPIVPEKKKEKEEKTFTDEEIEEVFAKDIADWTDFDTVTRVISLAGALEWLEKRPHLKNPKKLLEEVADQHEVEVVKEMLTRYSDFREAVRKAVQRLKAERDSSPA